MERERKQEASDGSLHKVILRKRITVFGEELKVELRKRNGVYYFVDVYKYCEHDRGLSYNTLDEALKSFEFITGCSLTDEFKKYLKNK